MFAIVDRTNATVFNLRTGEELSPPGSVLFTGGAGALSGKTPGGLRWQLKQGVPLVFDPNARIVRRLMATYERATGEHPPPAISGGGTYAKRIPNAIAYGMWFSGKPYTGHDVDEKIEVADLERGLDVLIETLRDLAGGPPLQDPMRP